MLEILKSHYKRFGKFAFVGIINTVIDFSIYSILIYHVGLFYLWAHFFAFLAANINSFVFNSLWTFNNLRHDAIFSQILRFFSVSVIGLLISTGVLHLSVQFFESYLHLSLLPPMLFGKVVAIAFLMVWNYSGFWLFVFKRTPDHSSD